MSLIAIIISPAKASELWLLWNNMQKSSSAATDLKQVAEIMKAMAHNERLSIARLLFQNKNSGLTVKAIYQRLKLPQPIVSRHLAIMKNAGAVKRTRQGQSIYYCLCPRNRNIENVLNCFC